MGCIALFYALNVTDGSLKWEFTVEGSIMTKPLLHNGTVYFGSLDKHLYAVDTASGKLKWKYTGENWFWSSPLIHKGNIYAGCLDNYVYVIDADTGNKVNEYDLGSPVSSSPVIVGDSVIFAARNGVIYSIDSVSGGLRTLAQIEEEEIYGPLTEYNGVVYIHTQAEERPLHRINAVDGSVLRTISLAMP